MTAPRVELVQAVYAAVNRGELSALAPLVGHDFEWHPDRSEPESRVRRTEAEALTLISDFASPFESFSVSVEGMSEEGDCVIAQVRFSGRMPGSAVSVERREAHLWSFAGERPRSMREFESFEEAKRVARAGGS